MRFSLTISSLLVIALAAAGSAQGHENNNNNRELYSMAKKAPGSEFVKVVDKSGMIGIALVWDFRKVQKVLQMPHPPQGPPHHTPNKTLRYGRPNNNNNAQSLAAEAEDAQEGPQQQQQHLLFRRQYQSSSAPYQGRPKTRQHYRQPSYASAGGRVKVSGDPGYSKSYKPKTRHYNDPPATNGPVHHSPVKYGSGPSKYPNYNRHLKDYMTNGPNDPYRESSGPSYRPSMTFNPPYGKHIAHGLVDKMPLMEKESVHDWPMAPGYGSNDWSGNGDGAYGEEEPCDPLAPGYNGGGRGPGVNGGYGDRPYRGPRKSWVGKHKNHGTTLLDTPGENPEQPMTNAENPADMPGAETDDSESPNFGAENPSDAPEAEADADADDSESPNLGATEPADESPEVDDSESPNFGAENPSDAPEAEAEADNDDSESPNFGASEPNDNDDAAAGGPEADDSDSASTPNFVAENPADNPEAEAEAVPETDADANDSDSPTLGDAEPAENPSEPMDNANGDEDMGEPELAGMENPADQLPVDVEDANDNGNDNGDAQPEFPAVEDASANDGSNDQDDQSDVPALNTDAGSDDNNNDENGQDQDQTSSPSLLDVPEMLNPEAPVDPQEEPAAPVDSAPLPEAPVAEPNWTPSSTTPMQSYSNNKKPSSTYFVPNHTPTSWPVLVNSNPSADMASPVVPDNGNANTSPTGPNSGNDWSNTPNTDTDAGNVWADDVMSPSAKDNNGASPNLPKGIRPPRSVINTIGNNKKKPHYTPLNTNEPCDDDKKLGSPYNGNGNRQARRPYSPYKGYEPRNAGGYSGSSGY
ncbi:hypothetical protein BJ085DRAFT_30278 [Dimargaris cristalligena]|uniref:Uncharacterized protein n=1 Tax=Dimargaris cristalligena TaxID=215637 RepID=A0A4P9ZWB2_9FUNG|nr:hypothetical protein BJ085DRAFT_30278 [Dimargaris cristalligena]|eukprot:RKP37598.1 hypothetical protein BJ085DRAFT_30278 [Dimargaris cristalligena]